MRSLGRWGWLAAIGALVCSGFMALLMTNQLADKARDTSAVALDGAGLQGAVDYVGMDGFDGIGSDGLNVTVEGPASAETAAIDALEARSEIDRVTYRVTEGDSVVEPETEDSETADSDPAPSVALDPVSIAAASTGTAVSIQGLVPDAAMRDALITAAVNEYGAANVSHDLVVDAESVTAEGGVFILTGNAASDDERSEWLDRATAVAVAGGLEFVDESLVQQIDEALNERFQLEPIEFDINQATIRARSEPTLDAAAQLINANPDVRLRVVGHTDSDGSVDANQRLSEARAQAVVDYLVTRGGVAAGRLEAEGRGEAELLFDPENTPEDKQRNRRIEWELLS